MNLKQKTITHLVKAYRKLPFKPCSNVLRNAYYKFLKSDIQNRTVIKNVDGINYELDLTEVIDSAIYFNNNREPHTSNALKRLCLPGMTIFDIGANVGSHTLPIAKSVGKRGKVYAFEPVPWALDKLQKNLNLNYFNNVLVHPIALSDVINENAEFSLRASFQTASKNPVNKDGSLNDNWWSACEKVKVNVNTLDNFIVQHKISNVDVIKLDVDGFEEKVLNGGLNLLKTNTPSLVMELAPSWLSDKGNSVNSLINMLQTLGYSILNEETFQEIPNIYQRLSELNTGSGINVVCIHESKKKLFGNDN